MRTIVALMLVLASGLFAAGCSRQSAYVNPDEPDKLGGTGIDSGDVRSVAQVMSRDLLNSPAIANAPARPIIGLLPTENETRFPVDTDIITQAMRDSLMQFAGDRARFVQRERRQAIEAERASKRSGDLTANGQGTKLGVDYFLTGRLKSISKSVGGKVSDYIYYSFELIDAETEEVVWAKGYDVKKVGERGVLYR